MLGDDDDDRVTSNENSLGADFTHIEIYAKEIITNLSSMCVCVCVNKYYVVFYLYMAVRCMIL